MRYKVRWAGMEVQGVCVSMCVTRGERIGNKKKKEKKGLKEDRRGNEGIDNGTSRGRCMDSLLYR